METEKIPVSFTCKKCGEKLSWSDDSTDSTEIKCQKCGERFGTYADLRNAALEAVRDKAVSIMKDAFKQR
jgi:DNA-directed RNA polymerase subunit RPC12/RpoP